MAAPDLSAQPHTFSVPTFFRNISKRCTVQNNYASTGLHVIKNNRPLSDASTSKESQKKDDRSAAFCAAALSLRLALLLPPAFVTEVQSTEKGNTQRVGLADIYTGHKRQKNASSNVGVPGSGAHARRRFEDLLLSDIVRTARLPKSRIALDEFMTICTVPLTFGGIVASKCHAATATLPIMASDMEVHGSLVLRLRHAVSQRTPSDNCNGNILRDQQLKKKKNLGWTKDLRNVIIAKFTIVGTNIFNAHDVALKIATAAKDESSSLRRLGAICCCCLDGTATMTMELRRRSWSQYWAFFVSPVFFGYKSRELLTKQERYREEPLGGSALMNKIGKPNILTSVNIESSDSDFEESKDVLVPPPLKSGLLRRELNAYKARDVHNNAMKRPVVLGFDNVVHMTACFSASQI